jgi:hypothetical protein
MQPTGVAVADHLLAHTSPLVWSHINLTGVIMQILHWFAAPYASSSSSKKHSRIEPQPAGAVGPRV